jgi:type 1 glutamine amidotransferase
MKTIRKLIAVFLLSALLLTFASCGAPFSYDKEKAVKISQQIVDLANTKKYEDIVDMLPENLKSQITAEKLKGVLDPMLTSSGAFTEYTGTKTSGVTQNSVNYVIVVTTCKYLNETHTFTITYTTDFNVAALEVK